MSRTVLSLALSLVIGGGCSKSAEPPAPSSQAQLTTKSSRDPAAARTLIAAGAVVVDVRTPEEFGAGALPGATNIPIDQFAARLAEIGTLAGGDKARPVVVYCASGARSKRAQQQLEAAGHTQVVNGGGFDELR